MPDSVPAVARSESVQRCTELYWTDSLAGESVHLLLCQLKHEIGMSSSLNEHQANFRRAAAAAAERVYHNANNLRFDRCVATALV